MNNGSLISSTNLTRELLAFGLQLDHIELFGGGLDYYCPGLDWVLEFGKQIADNRVDYKSDVYVCEQFARYAASEADTAAYFAGVRQHHTFGEARGTSVEQGGQGLGAIGKSHALNMVRCSDGKWYIFDPQNCEDPANIIAYSPDNPVFRAYRWRG